MSITVRVLLLTHDVKLCCLYIVQSDYDAKMKRMEEKLDAVEQKFTTEMSELQHVITRQTRDIEDSLNAQKRDLATKIDMLKKESDCLKRELELETRKLAVSFLNFNNLAIMAILIRSTSV